MMDGDLSSTVSSIMGECEQPLMKHEDDMCEGTSRREHQRLRRLLSKFSAKGSKVTKDTIIAIVYCVVPSFAMSRNHQAVEKRSHTEFMNGLKGLAALIVYIGHFVTPLHPQLLDGYGQNEESIIWQLPFVRIVYSGTAMVALFFVISGFVLSKTAVDHIKQGNYEQASKALAASIFKRAFRLYPAPIVSTFLVMLASRASFYDDPVSPRLKLRRPLHLDTWYEQILDWMSFVVTFLLNPWQWFPRDPKSHYGAHLWTISISFTCSVFLFAGIIGLSRLRTHVFIFVTSLAVIYNLFLHREPLGLFFFGMLLAYTSSKKHLELQMRPGLKHRNILRHTWPTCMVVFGLYLASYPVNGGALTPGYLSSLVVINPLSYFAVGAMSIVGGLLYQPFLQKPLCSRVATYLGKISFSFYIVHEPLLQIFGWRVFLAVEGAPELKYQSEVVRYLILVVACLIITGTFILIADLFWRFVEEPSTRFANSLKTKLFLSSDYPGEL